MREFHVRYAVDLVEKHLDLLRIQSVIDYKRRAVCTDHERAVLREIKTIHRFFLILVESTKSLNTFPMLMLLRMPLFSTTSSGFLGLTGFLSRGFIEILTRLFAISLILKS